MLIIELSNNENHSVNIKRNFFSQLIFSFSATRKEEVAGIRSKFPNSKFVDLLFIVDENRFEFSEIPVIVERYHKEKDLPILGKIEEIYSIEFCHC